MGSFGISCIHGFRLLLARSDPLSYLVPRGARELDGRRVQVTENREEIKAHSW